MLRFIGVLFRAYYFHRMTQKMAPGRLSFFEVVGEKGRRFFFGK